MLSQLKSELYFKNKQTLIQVDSCIFLFRKGNILKEYFLSGHFVSLLCFLIPWPNLNATVSSHADEVSSVFNVSPMPVYACEHFEFRRLPPSKF